MSFGAAQCCSNRSTSAARSATVGEANHSPGDADTCNQLYHDLLLRHDLTERDNLFLRPFPKEGGDIPQLGGLVPAGGGESFPIWCKGDSGDGVGVALNGC